ncbi:SPOR domain-containing protein [Pseudoalteromonas sp. G4]|uniref:SPOR domain-containing protein n=1 Tax=Pseudoalteromonas sp. G4 TaxID=2992761 RepID=UPI00237D5448|nr:SPOR domain-containing protein [Pseudoalteromonas sp. G4]MDE3272043.1 SPOR domain-containing protein [Pseudoalteromonas sp. G4]
MTSQFINRLVGTIIVVTAAIVFIPNILDGEKVQKRETFKDIPERPEFKAIELDPEPDQTLARESLPSTPVIEEAAIDEGENSPFNNELSADQQIAQTEAEIIEEKKVATVEVDAKPAVNEVEVEPKVAVKRAEQSNLNEFAWVIQLGSFSHKANVDSLLAKLKSAGFTAFTKPIKTPSGTLTKVFVGPELDKQKLESQLPQLKKLTKLNGRVTQFEITN